MFYKSSSLLLIAAAAASLAVLSTAQDNHESCPFWADSGECDANPGYMLQNCKTSCARVAAMVVNTPTSVTPNSFYEIREKDINGLIVDFAQFQGKVVYIVNVASHCGYTESNYQMIRSLMSKYGDSLEVILFPCNQFGAQEPGSGPEIKSFAASKGYSGLIMSKGDVNGNNVRPTFKFLKDRTAKTYITWNFDGKFIVDKTGTPHYIDDNNVDGHIQKYMSEKEL